MALIMKRMWPMARCGACQSAFLAQRTSRPSHRRAFTSTTVFRAEDANTTIKAPDEATLAKMKASVEKFAKSLDPYERAQFDALSFEEKVQTQQDYEELPDEKALWQDPAIQAEINAAMAEVMADTDERLGERPSKPSRFIPGVIAMGEEDEEGTGPDDEFLQDDISSLGHGNLDTERDIREYARIAAWEMPLLSKYAKAFEPPGKDRPLRFRYTTYLGEKHPAEKKVVVEFCTQDMPDLTEVQRHKLIKLVGVRYNPDTDIVKMNCEMFETQAQNKRYLGDLIETLLREARDPSDTFEDVPFDFRHHKPKRRPEFPTNWFITAERSAYLEARRKSQAAQEARQIEQGLLIDGLQLIQRSYEPKPLPSLSSSSFSSASSSPSGLARLRAAAQASGNTGGGGGKGKPGGLGWQDVKRYEEAAMEKQKVMVEARRVPPSAGGGGGVGGGMGVGPGRTTF